MSNVVKYLAKTPILLVQNTMLRDSGIVSETCFPWQSYECPCDTSAKCLSPTKKINIATRWYFNALSRTNEQIKDITFALCELQLFYSTDDPQSLDE